MERFIRAFEDMELSERFLVKLAFFAYDKDITEIPFINHRIDSLLQCKEFHEILKRLQKTHFAAEIRKLRVYSFFGFLRHGAAKKVWYSKIFYFVHKLTKEICHLTHILDEYMIEYKLADSNHILTQDSIFEQIHELFQKRYDIPALSKTALKKKAYARSPYADKEHLRDEIMHNLLGSVLAIHKGKVIGFAFAKHLELEYEWINICEFAGLIVDPGYRGYGIAENMSCMADSWLASYGRTHSIDYSLNLVTTFHPITIYITEKRGCVPCAIEIGGMEDYYGYCEPGFGNCDYDNFMFLVRDFKKEIENSADIVFVNREDYWFIRILYIFLRCRRRIVIIRNDAYRKIDLNRLKEVQEEIGMIKKQGKGAYFVDLSRKEAPAISRVLEKNNFYLCGVMPIARTAKGTRHDYAYYRYLDENKTVYPYMFTHYLSLGTRYKFMMSFLKMKAIQYFNNARSKNRIPNIGVFYSLRKR